MSFLTNIKTAEQLALEAEAAAKRARERELIALLDGSDFKVADDYDQPIGDLKEQRQAWRDEVRSIHQWLEDNAQDERK